MIKAALASYLVAWLSVSAIPIGALGVLFTSYLVRAGWTQDMYRPLSRAAFTLPVCAVLFLPVLIGLSWVYPWATDANTLPPFKAAYLTPWFFVLRTFIYFAIWTALAFAAARAYGDDAAMQRTASAGLVIWALTVSFAGIDWIESVEPHFHSSIYGLLVLSFDLFAAFGFALVVVMTQAAPRQMSNTAYAGVLLSMILLWAYLHAMQYIIVWAGNLPEEQVWYLQRATGFWGMVMWLLAIAQFVGPFFALLSERVRSSTRVLLWIAGVSLAMRFAEAALLVLPPLGLPPIALTICIPAAAAFMITAVLVSWRATESVLPRLFLSRSAVR
jgi:hypothetical protein